MEPVVAVPVVGTQWIAEEPVELELKERVFSWTGDSFDITDTATKQPYFILKPKLFSMSSRKTFSAADGVTPAFHMNKAIWSTHSAQRILSPSDELICVLKKKKFIQIRTSDIQVFPTEDSKAEPSYYISGDWRRKKFHITRVSDGASVASIQREGGFTARNILAAKDTYFVQVPKGGDIAFAVATAVAADEMFNDYSENAA